jgi:hypothetical protein
MGEITTHPNSSVPTERPSLPLSAIELWRPMETIPETWTVAHLEQTLSRLERGLRPCQPEELMIGIATLMRFGRTFNIAIPDSAGIGGRVPDEARAPVGGHPRQSNRRDHGELEVGQPDADAGGHPGLSTASYHAPDDAPGQGGNSPTEAENTDGLDIPDFLKRGLAASGAHD